MTSSNVLHHLDSEYAKIFEESTYKNFYECGNLSMKFEETSEFFRVQPEDMDSIKHFTPSPMMQDNYFSTYDISPCYHSEALSYPGDSVVEAERNEHKLKCAKLSYSTKPNWSKFVSDLDANTNQKHENVADTPLLLGR